MRFILTYFISEVYIKRNYVTLVLVSKDKLIYFLKRYLLYQLPQFI